VKARASLLHPFLYIQSPDEMVEAGNLHKEPISFWTLRYKPAFIQQLLEDHLEYGTVLPAFPRTTVENSSLNQELALATQRAVQAFLQPTSRLMRQTLILNLLVETFRHCADRPQREQRLGFEHHAVKKIKEYLRQHFTSEVSLEDLSSLTKLNKYHLLQIFKRDVGISPHIYQTSLRIHRAKQQLATGASIAQVALDVGFVDQSHFGRQFKKYVRVTPGQFQRDSLSS
jgi:AraC-like DNA-binding protein